MAGAETALSGVNISIRDMAGNMRPVSGILDSLAGKWYDLTDEQRQNLGVQIAGRQQLSRFLALMNNYDIATEATATSINSQNSAMVEQQKYAESLEGRINRLDTAWNKVVISAGEAVVNDGLILGVETLADIATVSSSAINAVGLLSGVFGTLGVAVLLLSTRFRTFSSALIMGTASMNAQKLSTIGLSVGMTRLGVTMVGVKAALRGLLLTSVVGAGFAALGFIIEKVVGHFADAKQSAEEFDQQQQTSIDALTTNKAATEDLIATYDALGKKKEEGKIWSTEDEKEYLQVQTQLAQTFPNLIAHYDATGQAHLKSSEAIQKEVEATNDLIEAKKKEVQDSATSTFADLSDTRDSASKKSDKKTNHADDLESVAKDTEKNRQLVANLRREASAANTEFVSASQQIVSHVLKVADSYNSIEIDGNIGSQIDTLVSSLDTSELKPSELDALAKGIASFEDQLQKAYDTADKEGFNKAKKSLTDFLQDMGMSDVATADFKLSIDSLTESELKMADATYTGEESISELSDEAAEAAGNIELLKNATETLAGTTQDEVDALTTAVNTYRLLSDAENLSAEQKELLAAATQMLSDTYPYLIEGSDFHVEAMEREIEQQDILLKASDMLAEGQLTNEEQTTLAMVMHTKARLKILADQVRMYEQAAERYAEIAAQESEASKGSQYASSESDENFLKASKSYSRAQSLNSSLADEIEASMPDMDKHMQQLADATNYQGRYYEATEESTEAQKENNEETEKSIYIADKYQQQLAELNGELAKLNRLKSQYPQHSKKYRDAVQKEIKLQEEMLKLNQSEQKSLSSQIKNKNVTQTGVVTTKSGSAGSSAVADYYLNSFHKTSDFGEHRGSSTHGGLDLANGKQGDPVKALQSGKVTQAYYSKSGGYMVVIEQDDGIVSKYMHMQKGLKVKAGQRVNAGDQLGKVGNTGDSTGAHLHLQMEKGGVKIDPEPILKALRSESSGKSSSTSSKYTGQYAAEINKAANRYGVDPFLIASIIQNESNFKKNVISSAGAQGLMQLMPATAKSLGVKDALNAEDNIMGGTKYISQMIKQFGDLETALAAYNAGPGNVNKYGGIPPFKETQNYVNKVMASYNKAGGGTGSTSDSDASRELAESEQRIDEAKLELIDLGSSAEDIKATIEELRMALVESQLAEFDNRRKQLEDDYAEIDRQQAKLTEGTQKWMEFELKRDKLIQDEQKIQKESVDWLTKEIKNNKDLTEAQKSLLNDELIDRTKELYDIEQQLIDQRRQLAESAIDTMKEMLEAQKKIATDTIDDMISEIDKIAEEADYAENLRKAQDERKKILDEMDKLALDGSDSGRKRMAELSEELKETDESLNDMVEENTRNKRKENLEQERERVEQEYDDVLNDEAMWENVRTDVIDGKTSEIMKSFTNMLNSIKNETEILGKSVVNNLKNDIDGLNAYLKGVKTSDTKGKFTSPTVNTVQPATVSTLSTVSTGIANAIAPILQGLNINAIKTPTLSTNSTTSTNNAKIEINIDKIGTESEFKQFMEKFNMSLTSMGFKFS